MNGEDITMLVMPVMLKLIINKIRNVITFFKKLENMIVY